MLQQKPKQLSFHSLLYNKIPKNHILKRIESVVDFSFVNKLLEESYCKTFGRPVKEPEMMCKLLRCRTNKTRRTSYEQQNKQLKNVNNNETPNIKRSIRKCLYNNRRSRN